MTFKGFNRASDRLPGQLIHRRGVTGQRSVSAEKCHVEEQVSECWASSWRPRKWGRGWLKREQRDPDGQGEKQPPSPCAFKGLRNTGQKSRQRWKSELGQGCLGRREAAGKTEETNQWNEWVWRETEESITTFKVVMGRCCVEH